MIFAKINGQSIRALYDSVASDSVEFLRVKFEYSDEWNGFVKTVVFESESADKAVSVVLEDGNPLYLGNNTCLVPFEVIKSPEFTLSVFGVKGDSLITTDTATVRVLQSGYCEGDVPAEPTPSEYQQIIDIVSAAKQTADSLRADADSGAFIGPQGPKGDKGDRGDSGVYVGPGEMPEDCNVQIDISGEVVDMSDYASKDYVDNRLLDIKPEDIELDLSDYATKENIESINEEINTIYERFDSDESKISANESKINDLYSRCIDYIVEQGAATADDIIWNYEKWSSGKAVCWCRTTVSDVADPGYVYSKECKLPFNFIDTDYCVLVNSYQAAGLGANVFQYYSTTTESFWIGSNEPEKTASVYVVGKWK